MTGFEIIEEKGLELSTLQMNTRLFSFEGKEILYYKSSIETIHRDWQLFKELAVELVYPTELNSKE